MKLSNDTREVLKNFSTINQNLLVKNGNTIGTMSAMKNIVSKATIPDTFNNEFAIYDLNEFLSALSLFKDPTLSFDEKSVRLNEEGGGSNLTYMFSDPSIVTARKISYVRSPPLVETVSDPRAWKLSMLDTHASC